MPTSPPISATEASSQTGIPKRTILAAIMRGELKAHKLAGSTGAYIIDPRELDRYVTKREQRAAS